MCGGDLHVHLTLRAEGWGGSDLWGEEEVKVSNEIKKGQRLMNGRKNGLNCQRGGTVNHLTKEKSSSFSEYGTKEERQNDETKGIESRKKEMQEFDENVGKCN